MTSRREPANVSAITSAELVAPATSGSGFTAFWLLIATGVLVTACLAGVAAGFTHSLLVMRKEPAAADVIIVLGGEVQPRVEKAAALYHRGYAPRILVTGKNEANYIGEHLKQAGVPANVILLETAAKSTYENAAYTLPVLQGMKVRSALLVTSWFHSRRAAAVFATMASPMEIISVPTASMPFHTWCRLTPLREQIMAEYAKIAAYWFRYGISSFKGASGSQVVGAEHRLDGIRRCCEGRI